MCGLSGVAGRDLYPMDLDFFKDLLYLSAFRGRDSTGVAAIRTKKNAITLHKHDIEPGEFISAYGSKNGYLSDSRNDIMMGHARWATMGAINEANAHPFETQKYVGAHNGTLVENRFRDPDKTDSEMLFLEMDQRGIVETLTGLSRASAWAVSIYDKATKKLWLGRNDKRTLYVGFDDSAGVMFWSSELEMLHFVMRREGRATLSCFSLRPNFLYEIAIPDIKRGVHAPWISHEVPPGAYMPPVSNSAKFFSSSSLSHWDDIENSYKWDHDAKTYVTKSASQKSNVAKLLDEIEEDVESSRKEESRQNKLLF